MKKVLLATTMLVAGASIAAAEVTVSGDARMGVINDFGSATKTTFTSRARVSFGLSGESDSGLSFGASFRADNANDASKGTAGNVFVNGAFGKLSMGDVDGAAAAAVGQVGGVGLTGLGDTNEALYLANGAFGAAALDEAAKLGLTGATSVLYEYTAGSFSVYLSATDPAHSVVVVTAIPGLGLLAADVVQGDSYAIGAKYTVDAYTVALGYESLEVGVVGDTVPLADLDHLIVGVSGTFGGATLKANYGKADGTVDGDAADLRQYAVSASYTVSGVGVTGFLNNRKLDLAGAAEVNDQAIGLGVSYDLGGGATAKAGVARVKDKLDNTSSSAFDVGVAFSF